jgi:hypothetical protein
LTQSEITATTATAMAAAAAPSRLSAADGAGRQPDGTRLVEPEPGHSLVVLGDADEMVLIGEVADGE